MLLIIVFIIVILSLFLLILWAVCCVCLFAHFNLSVHCDCLCHHGADNQNNHHCYHNLFTFSLLRDLHLRPQFYMLSFFNLYLFECKGNAIMLKWRNERVTNVWKQVFFWHTSTIWGCRASFVCQKGMFYKASSSGRGRAVLAFRRGKCFFFLSHAAFLASYSSRWLSR